MDEPFGALDRNLREQMQLEIRRLHTELVITMLFVTHDQEEALTMSDRIVLMRDGEIEQQGTPSDLYFRPQTLFAARFLGDSNILPGKVSEMRDGQATVTMSGGTELRNCHAPRVSVGDDLQIVVRPENIRIVDQTSKPNPNGEFRLHGTTIDSIFLAGIIKTFIRLETGETFVSQRLTHHRAHVPKNGSSVDIAWSSDDTMLLRPDEQVLEHAGSSQP
jgi:putative spermidine/putrescine transport system ATP-binding protein